MLVLHLCVLATARLPMVYSSLSGTQRQCRVVAALAVMEAAAFPGGLLGVGALKHGDSQSCEVVDTTVVPLHAAVRSTEVLRTAEEAQPLFLASFAPLVHWIGVMCTRIVALAALLQHVPHLWHRLLSAQKSLLTCWSHFTVNEQAVVDEFCKHLPEQMIVSTAGVPQRVQLAIPATDCPLQASGHVSAEQVLLANISLAEDTLQSVKSRETELRNELLCILTALAGSGES